MRIIIIGAVAAGTSAAAKARRNNEDAEIVVYEKDGFISYSGCGMPYYLVGKIENLAELAPRNPAFFKSKYNVDIITKHEVVNIDPARKAIKVKNLTSGEVFDDHYDRLVLATGASPVIAPIKGVENPHVFTLRNITDVNRISEFIRSNRPQKAVVVGTGFIGLETCENLMDIGVDVTLVEMLPQVAPSLDSDMAVYVQEYLENQGVTVLTKNSVTVIEKDCVVLSDGGNLPANLVIMAIGVRPNTELAKKAGIELGQKGAIKVNQKMQTNIQDIYACGDCIEQYHLITGKPVYMPLGSTANKTGRIAGDCVTGGSLEFRGILATGIFKIFDLVVAQTGLSEREAIEHGYDVVVCHNIKPDKPEYMGGQDMIIKGIADKKSGRLIGAQIVGFAGVDKRIDVFVTAISLKARVEDLFHLDLAYAPPFSTAKDPVMYTGINLDNAINKGRPLITAQELDKLMKSGENYTLIDAREVEQYEESHIETAQNIPQAKLRNTVSQLDKDTVAITYCNKGITGNAVQNILLNNNFKAVYNLSGGHKQYCKLYRKNRNK